MTNPSTRRRIRHPRIAAATCLLAGTLAVAGLFIAGTPRSAVPRLKTESHVTQNIERNGLRGRIISTVASELPAHHTQLLNSITKEYNLPASDLSQYTQLLNSITKEYNLPASDLSQYTQLLNSITKEYNLPASDLSQYTQLLNSITKEYNLPASDLSQYTQLLNSITKEYNLPADAIPRLPQN